MKIHGRASVSEFLGDFVVYRNLKPLDPGLPSLTDLGSRLGLVESPVPRKIEFEHARVMVELLKHARAVEAPGTTIERLLYLGDTRFSDGKCFNNLCRAGGWSGLAFIGAEDEEPARVEIVEEVSGLYLANRWAALGDFVEHCAGVGFAIDERTAVIVDIDKTALGARGRNDGVINRARVEAVRLTIGDLLGARFDASAFESAYDRLNRVAYHRLTADNQDYLAYICLVLGSGLYTLDVLISDVDAGRVESFRSFIDGVDERSDELPTNLQPIHEAIYANVWRGDPTPFKTFRYNEFRTTLARMGNMADDEPIEALLRDEIVLTQEVRQICLQWREQGALLFGLSDKPDEASLPSPEQAEAGMPAIHRAETHVVGG